MVAELLVAAVAVAAVAAMGPHRRVFPCALRSITLEEAAVVVGVPGLAILAVAPAEQEPDLMLTHPDWTVPQGQTRAVALVEPHKLSTTGLALQLVLLAVLEEHGVHRALAVEMVVELEALGPATALAAAALAHVYQVTAT